MTTAKLCIECAHSVRVGNQWFCHHPNNFRDSLVNGGKVARKLPDDLRRSEYPEDCGPDAQWFLAREKA